MAAELAKILNQIVDVDADAAVADSRAPGFIPELPQAVSLDSDSQSSATRQTVGPAAPTHRGVRKARRKPSEALVEVLLFFAHARKSLLLESPQLLCCLVKPASCNPCNSISKAPLGEARKVASRAKNRDSLAGEVHDAIYRG